MNSEWRHNEGKWERIWIVRYKTDEELKSENWLYDYALRIIIPKTLVQQNRNILIFKSYFEIMDLPMEIHPDKIHLYCNEILPQDQDTVNSLQPYGVIIEKRM